MQVSLCIIFLRVVDMNHKQIMFGNIVSQVSIISLDYILL